MMRIGINYYRKNITGEEVKFYVLEMEKLTKVLKDKYLLENIKK